jgi:hypothetical protein
MANSDDTTPPGRRGEAWAKTIAREQARFARGKKYLPGSNRAIAYEFLTRREGTTVDEFKAAIKNQSRTRPSAKQDLADIALFAKRELVQCSGYWHLKD